MAFGLVAAAVGCNNSTPGGPGADKAKKDEKNSTLKNIEDKVREAPETFSVKTPTLGTALKQDEKKVVTLSISRGKNFDQDVVVKFDKLPQGVTVEPSAPTIKHGESETKVTVQAAGDAAVGKFTVKVTGHPAKGSDSSTDWTVHVEKK
jgi:hypothetical protein